MTKQCVATISFWIAAAMALALAGYAAAQSPPDPGHPCRQLWDTHVEEPGEVESIVGFVGVLDSGDCAWKGGTEAVAGVRVDVEGSNQYSVSLENGCFVIHGLDAGQSYNLRGQGELPSGTTIYEAQCGWPNGGKGTVVAETSMDAPVYVLGYEKKFDPNNSMPPWPFLCVAGLVVLIGVLVCWVFCRDRRSRKPAEDGSTESDLDVNSAPEIHGNTPPEPGSSAKQRSDPDKGGADL